MWMELIPLLKENRDFAVWPFEGKLERLLTKRRIVLAESYPGLAYAVALAETLPTHRLVVAKTRREPREKACDLLERAGWVGEAGVKLGDLAPARADEDPFDSHLMAAAALRCLIEGQPLRDPGWVDEVAEGGMLLAGPVAVERRATTFKVEGAPRKKSSVSGTVSRPRPRRPKAERAAGGRDYPCPIPVCTKIFGGGRRGWDGPALSVRTHPDWHPEVKDQEERKRLFREEHEEWFGC